MRNLPRKAVEEAFLGKICQAIHPVIIPNQNNFWCYPVRVEPDGYQLNNEGNIIKEHRLKGSKHTWITSSPIPLTIEQTDRVLVVDIVRNISGPTPTWDAIVLIGEQAYSISAEALVLETDE